MSSKRGPKDGLDLSLTGSQISKTSGRNQGRPISAKGAKRPSSAKTTSTTKHDQNISHRGSTSAVPTRGRTRTGSNSSLVDSKKKSSGQEQHSGRKESARDDFLSFFEGSNAPPKILKPSGQTSAKTAWGSDVMSSRPERQPGSHVTTESRSKFSHSVFQPQTARSNSTDEDEDLLAYALQNPPNLSINLEDMSDSNLNTHRNHNHSLNSHRTSHREVPGSHRTHREDINHIHDNIVNTDLSARNTNRRSSGGGRYTNQINSMDDNLNYMPSSDDMLNSSRSGRNNHQLSSRNAAALSSRVQEELSSHAIPIPGRGNNHNTPHLDISSKSHKLNSIANNMTSQALSPGTKTPLENAFQNIKHKTPVNQVRQSPHNNGLMQNTRRSQNKLSSNEAAVRLQRWFRRHLTRRRAGEAAMRRLMTTKRQEKRLEQEREGEEEGKEVEDRKRQREAKARQARQQAIKELHERREAKRTEDRRIAEQEVQALQAAGKVGRGAANKSNVKRNKAPVNQKVLNGHHSRLQEEEDRPGTPVSAGRRLDEMFQNHSSPDQRSGGQSSDGESDDAERDGGSSGGDRERGWVPERAVDAGGAVASKTTLDDLMDTLRKLEEEDKFDTKCKNTTPQNWLDDLERQSESSKSDHLSAERINSMTRPTKDNLKKNAFLTDEKLKSIMSFLDEVETADKLDELDQGISHMNSERMATQVPSGEEIAQLEQATAAAAEVTNTVLAQRLELDDRKRTVSMLQKALNQQRELTVRHARETEREMKKRLEVQKDDAEDTIKRHLSFIDQLIDDKKSLSEKCEKLVKELKTVDKKYQDKLKSVTEKHDIELRKIKDMQAAAEKLRRERWIDEKTKKIKEMTVKGLEPEIQRLIAKHKEEVRKIKAIHEAELLASDERAGQRYITMTEELRDQLQHEKEAACARERELARQTYESQLTQEESAYQQQRRRLHAEVQEEKERLAQQASRQRAELDKLQRQLEDSHGKASEAMRSEYEKAREEQERRHTTEVRQLREQLAVEKTAWEENYRKKQETWLLAKERELKEQVRRERDKEIEMVISRLEEDGQTGREECERVAENRIKRIRDKYEGELSELERSERLTTEKYNKTKAELAEMEGENERMKVTLRQKDKEVAELKKLLDKLNEERSHVSDVIRQEFADRIVATEEENKRIKTQISELKARHKIELERAKAEIEVVTKSKEEEMEELHKRVKQAIVKKEDVVSQLRQQFDAAQKRADHLEGLLEQQRKQLLAKK